MLRRVLAGALGIAALAGAAWVSPAWAHHSYAMFDMTRSVDLKGKVVQFKWTNPHAWLMLDVKDAAATPSPGTSR